MRETDIGIASETELVRNDGEIADTLESYLFKNGMTDEIKNSIKIFQEWLRESLVLTKNLIPHNLVIKQNNDEMLIKIIDGLGSQAFVTIPSNSNFFAKRYVERRIELMDNRIK